MQAVHAKEEAECGDELDSESASCSLYFAESSSTEESESPDSNSDPDFCEAVARPKKKTSATTNRRRQTAASSKRAPTTPRKLAADPNELLNKNDPYGLAAHISARCSYFVMPVEEFVYSETLGGLVAVYDFANQHVVFGEPPTPQQQQFKVSFIDIGNSGAAPRQPAADDDADCSSPISSFTSSSDEEEADDDSDGDSEEKTTKASERVKNNNLIL